MSQSESEAPAETTQPQPGPREIAQNEAARQAVILVFGLASAYLLLFIHKQMMREFMPGSENSRAAAALIRERRWGKTAVYLWTAGLLGAARWAEMRSVRARAEYESLRP